MVLQITIVKKTLNYIVTYINIVIVFCKLGIICDAIDIISIPTLNLHLWSCTKIASKVLRTILTAHHRQKQRETQPTGRKRNRN